ncbi:MAG: hypothetical protein HOO67_06650 [Candidatus Peribacteraceae bacterium]|nr:hypothetical protein [Candidatus Peribacteraceae bacterium]
MAEGHDIHARVSNEDKWLWAMFLIAAICVGSMFCAFPRAKQPEEKGQPALKKPA